MKTIIFLVAIFAIAASRGIVYPVEWPWSQFEPLKTVDNFAIERFLGHWFEIASIPNSWDFWGSGCNCSQSDYTANYDGTIKVVNVCNFNSTFTNVTRIEGTAWMTDKPSKLQVEYFYPLNSRLWIMEIDNNYGYALIGEPSRKKLWILSRYPYLDMRIYNHLVTMAAYQGFPTEKLRLTEQSCGWLN